MLIKQLEENDIPAIVKSAKFYPAHLEDDLEMVLRLAEKHDQVVWVRHDPGFIQWMRVDADEAANPVFRQQVRDHAMWINRRGRSY